jgi:SAM-dependent methyltransferase
MDDNKEERVAKELRDYLTSSGQSNVNENLDNLILNDRGYIGRFEFFTPYISPDYFDSILISGCAAGSELIVAKSFGFKTIYGVDVDAKLIDIAKKRFTKDEFRLMTYDGVSLDIPSESISTVYSGHVIEHTGDPEAYFIECLRVIRDGGYFFLEFPNRYHWQELHTRTISFEWLPYKLRQNALLFLEEYYLKKNLKLSSLFRDVRTTLRQISIGAVKKYISNQNRNVEIIKISRPTPGYVRMIMRVTNE